MVTALAVIGGAVVAVAVAGGIWHLWRWLRGAADLP
jgi:hypothetical protein